MSRIFHPCLLCGKNITHTQDTLRQHMNLSHQKLALGIYYEKAVKRVNAAKQWINKCTFACMTCGQFQTHERNAFVKHLKVGRKIFFSSKKTWIPMSALQEVIETLRKN